MAANLGYFYFSVPDLERATRFYSAVLGWQAGPGDNARDISGSSPPGSLVAGPQPDLTVYFEVPDAVAAAKKVAELGGKATEPQQSESGWSSEATDPGGVAFGLWQPAPAVAPDGPAKGDIGDLYYFTIPDTGGARTFYGELFGWEFDPGNVPGGWHIKGTVPAAGIAPSGDRITVYFRTADVAVTVAAVRAAGGTAEEPQQSASGWYAQCQDDQGNEFSIAG